MASLPVDSISCVRFLSSSDAYLINSAPFAGFAFNLLTNSSSLSKYSQCGSGLFKLLLKSLRIASYEADFAAQLSLKSVNFLDIALENALAFADAAFKFSALAATLSALRLPAREVQISTAESTMFKNASSALLNNQLAPPKTQSSYIYLITSSSLNLSLLSCLFFFLSPGCETISAIFLSSSFLRSSFACSTVKVP